jgi:catechol 2,3-dioxygenase-like lactoylglutathione lyase family enzyme
VVEPIKCIEMQHFNLAARDFEASMDHFQHVWGAQFVHDMPGNGWHAVLLYLGGVLFEMFVPHQFLLNGRYGPHWVGIEYQIGDLRVTRDALGDRGVDLIRDVGIAIHTDPSQCFGVAFEFYDHSFFAEPFDWLEPLRPPEYWEQEHPLGLMGLKRYSVAVADLDAALGFYRDMFDVEVLYQDERPSVGLRATGVRLANTIVELQAPTGEGPVARHLARYGDGLRSVVFRVKDLDRAVRHFAGHGITLVPGDQPGSLAVPPGRNRGIMMEVAE